MENKHDARVPAHLRQYVAQQRYGEYTSIDHDVWRYVMKRNAKFLGEKAHPSYLPGLHAAGISLETIPDVAQMNASLSKLGWGAVVVDGLIPGVAFFDFQAHGLLPISADIRSLEHIEYTPAPDIIHEAAGHAPILYDEKYAEYVKIFGQVGSKALGTKEGHEVFDAVRNLTIVMENPLSTQSQKIEAERILEEKQNVNTKESEESLVSRLYWWTVEYGLIGDLARPTIYGAGLLSSVKEGKLCLTNNVKKMPFDLETCIRTGYDVTKPQPQLFVCENFEQLIVAVRKLSERMAFRVGGTESLEKAVESGRLATFVYSSGLQVTGIVTEVLKGPDGRAVYVKATGPSALAVGGQELPGHGKQRHSHGFGATIGTLAGTDKPLEHFTDEDLDTLHVRTGIHVCLTFRSGLVVDGVVTRILRIRGRIVLISFVECTVMYQRRVLFEPSWGEYDMAVGEQITSVFAGAADPESHFADMIPSDPGTPIVMSNQPTRLEQLYQQVRDLRSSTASLEKLQDIINSILEVLDSDYPSDWLARLDLLEIVVQRKASRRLENKLLQQLHMLESTYPHLHEVIHNGLALLDPRMEETTGR